MNLPSSARSIGELVAFADAIAFDQVTIELFELARQAEALHAQADPEYYRHLVVVGALANRALFEVEDLPKDRAFLIGPSPD